MAEEEIFPGVRHSSVLVGAAELQQVWLWDIGPKKPEMPRKPSAPKAPAGHKGEWKEGDPEYELAMVEFKETLDAYTASRAQYRLDLAAYAAWNKRFGGPYELRQFSCDAHDTLQRDPERYFISSRTRGHEKKKNGGLPEGMKPGPAHAENLRREQAGHEEFEAAMRADPVFGQQEIRQ